MRLCLCPAAGAGLGDGSLQPEGCGRYDHITYSPETHSGHPGHPAVSGLVAPLPAPVLPHSSLFVRHLRTDRLSSGCFPYSQHRVRCRVRPSPQTCSEEVPEGWGAPTGALTPTLHADAQLPCPPPCPVPSQVACTFTSYSSPQGLSSALLVPQHARLSCVNRRGEGNGGG